MEIEDIAGHVPEGVHEQDSSNRNHDDWIATFWNVPLNTPQSQNLLSSYPDVVLEQLQPSEDYNRVAVPLGNETRTDMIHVLSDQHHVNVYGYPHYLPIVPTTTDANMVRADLMAIATPSRAIDDQWPYSSRRSGVSLPPGSSAIRSQPSPLSREDVWVEPAFTNIYKSQPLYNKLCISSLYGSRMDFSPGSMTGVTSTQIALLGHQKANVPGRSSRQQLQCLPAKNSSQTVTRGRASEAHRILKPTVVNGLSTKTWNVRRKQVSNYVSSKIRVATECCSEGRPASVVKSSCSGLCGSTTSRALRPSSLSRI